MVQKTRKNVKKSPKVSRKSLPKVSPVKMSPKKSTNNKENSKFNMKNFLGLGLLAGGSALSGKLLADRFNKNKNVNLEQKPVQTEKFTSEREKKLINQIEACNKEVVRQREENKKLVEHINACNKEVIRQREENKKLVEHINACNKEVIRQAGIIKSRPSLRKETILRNALNRFRKNS